VRNGATDNGGNIRHWACILRQRFSAGNGAI
jgi:hypothetical protein